MVGRGADTAEQKQEWIGWVLSSSIAWLILGTLVGQERLDDIEEWFQKTSMNTKRRSFIIGQSCLWFLIPAMTKWMNNKPIWSLLFVGLTITSFMGDYVTSGRRSWWHGIDFWYAISVCSYTLCRQWRSAPLVPKVAVLAAMANCYFGSKRAARAPGGVAGNYGWYTFWHSNWHHIGAVFAAFTCGPYSVYAKYWPGQDEPVVCDPTIFEGLHQTGPIFITFITLLTLKWQTTKPDKPPEGWKEHEEEGAPLCH